MTDEASTPGYAEAIDELAAIVARLESDDLDVDELESSVARAAELVSVCRGRIDATRLRVDELVAGLEQQPDAG